MKKPHRRLFVSAVLCGLTVLLTWAGTSHIAVLRASSALLEDLQLAYFGPAREPSDDVVILSIDEDALATLPFRSPISRRFLADILQSLAPKRPRAVGIDVIFDQPTTPDDDQALLDALDDFPAPVVIAVGTRDNGLTDRQLDFQTHYLDGRSVGSATLHTVDGVVRFLYPREPAENGRIPSFAAALATAVGVAPPAARERIYYRAPSADKPPLRAFPAASAEKLPTAWLGGRVVLIGAQLPNEDRFRTPLSALGGAQSTMAGTMIHAQAFSQLLDGERYPETSEWLQALVLAAVAVAGFALTFTHLKPWTKIVIGVGGLLSFWALATAYFAAGGVQLPLLAPSLGLALGASFGGAYARHVDIAEKRFVRAAFQRYVSPAVIDHVLDNPDKLVLGGEKREMSFIFSDLADFTKLAEQTTPEAVVGLLHDYFEGMLQIALSHGATVDRLVGDSIAVFFNAPADQPDHAQRAVRCALALDRYCEAFRADRIANGVPMGATRIGVHSGTAVVGNVGSTTRFHYTAHGDCVNTAARLESVNKHLGTRVCISIDTARHCPEHALRPVAHLVLKGKSQGIECVTLCDGLADGHLQDYLLAYAALAQSDPVSVQLFESLHARLPGDGLIAFHLGRLQRGDAGIRVVLEEK